MKLLKFISVACLSLLLQSTILLGQESDSTKTLFSSFKLKNLGLYIAPEASYSKYAGSYTGLGGASAMLLLNNKWAIGVHGQSSERRSFTPTDLDANKALSMRVRNAGLRIEYIAAPHKVFHFAFPLTLGIGSASVDSVNSTNIDLENDDYNNHGGHRKFNSRNGNNSNYGFIQPGLNLEVNIFKFGKIFFGANYRIATNITSDAVAPYTLTTAEVSGLNLNVGAKLGFFNYRVNKVQTVE
jgi:hypothetical protein